MAFPAAPAATDGAAMIADNLAARPQELPDSAVPVDATRAEVASAALSARVAWRRVHMRHRGCHLTMPVAEPCVHELVEVSCTSYCMS